VKQKRTSMISLSHSLLRPGSSPKQRPRRARPNFTHCGKSVSERTHLVSLCREPKIASTDVVDYRAS